MTSQLPSRGGGEGRRSSNLKDEKEERSCGTEDLVWLVRGFECQVVAEDRSWEPCCIIEEKHDYTGSLVRSFQSQLGDVLVRSKTGLRRPFRQP